MNEELRAVLKFPSEASIKLSQAQDHAKKAQKNLRRLGQVLPDDIDVEVKINIDLEALSHWVDEVSETDMNSSGEL